jgi:hypothetical protein
MKGLNRDKHIQIRLTDAEVKKYKEVSASNGLTVSGFARYSMARASAILREIKKEM